MPDVPERWFVDGLELTQGIVRNVESYDGLFTSTTLLATDISVPQRDGEVPGVARLSPGGFTLKLWLGASARSELERDWGYLLQVLMKRHRLVMFERRRPDGTSRQCYGRVTGRIAPTAIGRLGMRAQIEVTIPSGSWQDTALSDMTQGLQFNGPVVPVGWTDPEPGQKLEEDQIPPRDPNLGTVLAYNGTDGSATYSHGWVFDAEDHIFRRTGTLVSGPLDRYVEVTPLTGASAPLTNLLVQVTGPVDGLTLQCDDTGAWATYDLPLAAGQALTIDGGGDIVGAPRIDAFRYKGPYMIEMMPRDGLPPKAPLLRVRATQADPTATIRVRGRRLYQTM